MLWSQMYNTNSDSEQQQNSDDDDDEENTVNAKNQQSSVVQTSTTTTTTTTYEYDVVKCADFVEDKGCWVRNMPDEIRKVNPQFVPT
jgi:hypothetical protein